MRLMAEITLLDKLTGRRALLQELEHRDEERRQLYRAQFALALEISQLQQKRYVGNKYQDYATAVKEIEKKYNSEAEWGCLLTGNIIDLRAAFIIGNGIKVLPRKGISHEEAKEEIKFVEDFFEYNKLDMEGTVEYAKEAEIDGKIAIKIDLVEDADFKNNEYKKGLVRARYISWVDKQYKVKTEENDYMTYKELAWQPKANAKGETLGAGQFVYNKFGGRISKPDQAQPKVMKCLTQIEDVDMAYRDWREINHIFASPVFDVLCDNRDAVNMAAQAMDDYRMNVKKAFIHTGSTFDIKGPDMSGIESLKDEAVEKIKVISGTTGIPVHFLGLLDLLKNRATGDNTRELVIAGTEKERTIWKGTYKELIEKAMIMYNEKSQRTALDPNKLKVDISVYTEAQWAHVEKVLIPIYLAGGLSLQTLLSNIPGIDVEDELSRVEGDEKKKQEEDEKQAEMDALKSENEILRLNGAKIPEEEIM